MFAVGANFKQQNHECGIVLHNLASPMKDHSLGRKVVDARTTPELSMVPTSCGVRVNEASIADISAVIQLLLSAGAESNAHGTLYVYTVWNAAWKHQGQSKLYYLIKAGADLDLLGPDSGIPLQAVCSMPFESANGVTALLQASANPDLCDDEADRPLHGTRTWI